MSQILAYKGNNKFTHRPPKCFKKKKTGTLQNVFAAKLEVLICFLNMFGGMGRPAANIAE